MRFWEPPLGTVDLPQWSYSGSHNSGTALGAATSWWLLELPHGVGPSISNHKSHQRRRKNGSTHELGAVFREPFSGAATPGASLGATTDWRLQVPPLGSMEPFFEAFSHDYIRRTRMSSEHSWIRRIQFHRDTPEESYY